MKKRILKKINVHSLLIVLIVICIFEYGIQKICGFTMYPDEFGYWASAASAVGYDWSEAASLGSYYSFGYSLVLVPILAIIPDGVMAYRVAVFINMLLMCIGVFLFGKIIEKVFPEINNGVKIMISGAAVLYPAWIFYMQMTMVEAVLMFVFSFDIYLFYKFMENRKVSTAIALAAGLVFGYCVHMRTIGILIAGVFVCLCRLIGEKKNKKTFIIWFGVIVLLFGITLYLKNLTTVTVFSFAGEDALAVNDYGSQWGKFAEIFTFTGMIKFVCGVVGKLYYLGFASFGTLYWAFAWCLKESIQLIRQMVRKEDVHPRQWLALFLLLAVTGQVLISSIYMYDADVIDCLVYGRYNELLVPVMILIGIIAMSKSRYLIPVTVLMGTILGGITALLLHVIDQRNMSGIRGYHVAGISYLLQGSNQDVRLYFWHTWLLGFGLIMLVCAFVWLGKWRASTWWLYAGILVIEIAAGLQISNHYTYQVNYTNYDNMMIAEALQERSGEDIDVLYLDEDHLPFVDFLQMQIPEKTIHVITEDELSSLEGKNYIIITDVETDHDEELKELFDRKIWTNVFNLYYNR